MRSLARIRFTCSHCGRKLSVLPAAAGRTLPCPNPQCGEPITVPPPNTIETAQPVGSAMPANVPTSPAVTAASRPGAIVMIAASLSMLLLGAGLWLFLLRPYANSKRPGVHPLGRNTAKTVVKALANGNHNPKAAVNAAPKTKAVMSRSSGSESKRKLAAAKQEKPKPAHQEQAARKQPNKTLAEYAALARVQSSEYYHNDRRVIPRWHRPDSEATRERPLLFPKYDSDIPRVRPLAHSDNEDIRTVAGSILEAYAMAENYRNDGAAGSENVQAEYAKALTSSVDRNAAQERLNTLRGEPANTQQRADVANFQSAARASGAILKRRNANQAYITALEKLAQAGKRSTYKLAKQLAGPQPGKPPGVQVKVEPFAPGQDGSRGGSKGPSANAGYSIIVANDGKRLTHCSIAVIVRRRNAGRSAEVARPELGPAFGLDEFTEAVLEPEPSRSYPDGVMLCYVGDVGTHDRVRVLGLHERDISESLERVGVVVFSDQMTVVGDPNPALQEVSDKYLAQAGRSAENQAVPQNNPPATTLPKTHSPAGLQSSKRAKGNGAPRRN